RSTQRDIDKRDLQRALKYGRRESAWGERWLVEYDGITFITDSTMRREVTAYPSPLPSIDMDFSAIEEHLKAKRLFEQKPELSTSHTLIIIDNSGSMLDKKNDIHLYRDSQNAAFSLTALEFVAEQVLSKSGVNSDLVSLIKFSEHPSIEFSKEPMGWHVYNKILSHRDKQTYKSRQGAPLMDELSGGSNYLPALAEAQQLLESGCHDQLALSLFFYSDGRPTDHTKLGITANESYEKMKVAMMRMATQFGEALTVSMVGLGDLHDQFTPLKAMAEAATAAGAKGSFERCDRTAHSISSAISSTVTSTNKTRLTLQDGGRTKYTERSDLRSENNSFPKHIWRYFKIAGHLVYNPQAKELSPHSSLPLAAVQAYPYEASERQYSPPPFIAINRNYFGKGAERVAFRCRLSDSKHPTGFVFGEMTAKETKHEQRIERVDFHQGFAETQMFANYLANQFNMYVKNSQYYSQAQIPELKFLPCSVLLLEDPSWPVDGLRGVLVEKMLDTGRFPWTKWNDNNGAVNGKRAHKAVDVDFELKELQRENAQDFDAIAEDEEESDDDESLSDMECEGANEQDEEARGRSSNIGIDPSDYARECRCLLNYTEAFTHFTYRFTNKRVMVCDIQGVFNTHTNPPTLELTDPAIHYASAKGRRMVYGKTDKGRSGMNAFWKTHKCTKICKLLHLSAKNKRWNNNWREESAQFMFGI
ncbi:hypothetical protein ACHAWF_007757, partial [Thalassiosira exigua]